jgi:hypothetical protein
MGLIMIRCPESGREIPTGIEMDMAEFQRAPVFFPRCNAAIANMNGSRRMRGYATAQRRSDPPRIRSSIGCEKMFPKN